MVEEGSEGAEDKGAVETNGTERAGESAIVGGVGEVSQPPGECSSYKEGEIGEVRESNDLKTVMAVMGLGGEDMHERDGADVKQENAEVEEGRLGERGGLLAL